MTRTIEVEMTGTTGAERPKLGVISAFALLRDVEQRLRTEYHDDVADELHQAIDVLTYEIVRLKNPGPKEKPA